MKTLREGSLLFIGIVFFAGIILGYADGERSQQTAAIDTNKTVEVTTAAPETRLTKADDTDAWLMVVE